MKHSRIHPENLPETVIWYYLISTYLLYLLGAQYVAACLLGTFLTLCVLKQWWEETDKTPPEERIVFSPLNWVWIGAILTIQFSSIIGHLDNSLGMGTLFESTVFWWYPGWGLFILFTVAGQLKIRPEIIYRAACILCFQSLIVTAVFRVAALVHLPQLIYVSPLQMFGGGAHVSTINLCYVLDVDEVRLVLFTPWSPALGLVGNMYLWLALAEQNLKWRFLGIMGAVAMVITSASRMAMVTLPCVPILIWCLTHCFNPWFQICAGFLTPLFVMILPWVRQVVRALKERFHNARPGSSIVRKALRDMARQQWERDAFFWGHGVLSPKGPPVTGGVPVGTHHTWLGLLYIHGIFAFAALSIGFFLSFLDLGIKAFTHKTSRTGLAILTVLFLFSLGDNIDILAYLYWPGLIVMGQGFKEKWT